MNSNFKTSVAPWIWITTLISAFFLALFTYIQPGAPLEPFSLDSAWAYALNYTFHNNLIIGRDVYFTFGPLGFLEHARPLSLQILIISSIFWFVCSIISYTLIFLLCFHTANNKVQLLVNLALGLVVIFYASESIQRLLLIVYSGIFLHWITENRFYLILLGAACIFCLLIKFSYGLVALALYLPYLLTLTIRNKNPKPLITGLLVLFSFYILLWLIIYGSLSGVTGYLKGGLEFSQGSATAMALNPENNWPAIAIFFTAGLCALLTCGVYYRTGQLMMTLCFLGPLFIWSKYAFGREDVGHLSYLMSFIFYAGVLWLIATQNNLHKILCCVFLVICFHSWKNMHSNLPEAPLFSPRPVYCPPKTFYKRTELKALATIMQDISDKALDPLKLPSTLREQIGESSVDIYPWETMITAANHLNWTPRPIYQNYITYTPFLDAQNKKFYSGDKAPEYILWHHHSFADIDNRFLYSSDPLTLEAILTRYLLISCEKFFCLWKKQETDLLKAARLDESIEMRWNEWIKLPASESDIIRAHINPARTLLGRLNLFLWKEGGIEIDYLLNDGNIKTHTLVLDNATSGIWASPYASSLGARNPPAPVKQEDLLRLLKSKNAEGYIEQVSLVSNELHILGWGLLPFKDTRHQELDLLLYNQTHAFRVPAENRWRPGITEHFKKTGIVDLEYSGFDETFLISDVPAGTYQIRFSVRNEGVQSISASTASISFADKTTHNVQSIRFRTSRPWAFVDATTLSWSTLSFNSDSQ